MGIEVEMKLILVAPLKSIRTIQVWKEIVQM
jgi:hypothetical protein